VTPLVPGRDETLVAGEVDLRQPCLDPGHLGERRHPHSGDDLRLERARAPQLADARHDSVEAAEDRHGPLDTGRLPAGSGFERSQHFFEASLQVLQHVVAIEAPAVTGVQRRGRPAHEHGPRHENLQMALRRQQPFPLGQIQWPHATHCTGTVEQTGSESPRSPD